MITKNGKVALALRNNSAQRVYKNTSGSTTKYTSPMLPNTICVGRGITEPTENDIDLADRITTLTQISQKTNYSDVANYGEDLRTYCSTIYRNNTEENITITEIGLYYVSGSTYILCVRELLPTPVTIEVGKAYTFTMFIG